MDSMYSSSSPGSRAAPTRGTTPDSRASDNLTPRGGDPAPRGEQLLTLLRGSLTMCDLLLEIILGSWGEREH